MTDWVPDPSKDHLVAITYPESNPDRFFFGLPNSFWLGD
jgi:hypothetical protein